MYVQVRTRRYESGRRRFSFRQCVERLSVRRRIANELNDCLSVDEFACELNDCLSVDVFATDCHTFLPAISQHLPVLRHCVGSRSVSRYGSRISAQHDIGLEIGSKHNLPATGQRLGQKKTFG